MAASQLLSPVTGDAQVFAQGLNYQDHAAEAQQHVRRSNLIFAKASSSLTGPFSPIVRPAEVELLDYEVELGIVLRAETLKAKSDAAQCAEIDAALQRLIGDAGMGSLFKVLALTAPNAPKPAGL